MNIHWIIVNGKPECGKTTFENICKDILGDNCVIVSSIDGIKAVAYRLGWDGNKDLKGREFLSKLKQLANEYFDFTWWDVYGDVRSYCAERNIVPSTELFVFVDVREPKEIERYKKERGAITLLLRRDSVEDAEVSNDSDAGVFNYQYDYVIENNGTLKDLTNEANSFIIKVLKRGSRR